MKSVFLGEDIKEIVVDGGGSVTIACCGGWLSDRDIIKLSGKGTITYVNGDVYEGEFKDTDPHGPGKLAYNDGYGFHSRGGIIGSGVVEGIWKEGELDYEGDVDENGKPHGRGKGMFSSNNVYEGEWKNGLRHGKGTDASDNGSSYNGQWKHDKRNGKGITTTTHTDGSVEYDGEFKGNMYHGEGTYYFENGDVYTGQWRAGNHQGKGVMTYANQDQDIYTYDGEWEMNRKDGKGKLTFHNGDVFEGEFSNDKMHGKGTYTYAAGDIFKSIGEWKEKEGKKCGLFEDIVSVRVSVEVSKQVYYDEDEVKADSNVKREDPFDDDTDTDDAPSPKRRKVCAVSPR